MQGEYRRRTVCLQAWTTVILVILVQTQQTTYHKIKLEAHATLHIQLVTTDVTVAFNKREVKVSY